jgi:hypothetical protein
MSTRWRALQRSATVVAGITAFTLVSAGAALAFDSGGNPGGTGPNTITWTGNGQTNGVLNSDGGSYCQAKASGGEDPFGDNVPYLLWVLQTGGGSVSLTDPPPTLHTSGSLVNVWAFVDPSNTKQVKFTTNYVTPDPNQLQAFVDMNVTNTGGKNASWELNISHGCSGTPPTKAAPLTISKTADGAYTTTYLWNIQKSVDTHQINQAPGGATPFNYTVTVGHDAGTNSDVGVTGVITVSNPNSADAQITSLSDVLSNNVSCDLQNLGTTTIPGNGHTDYPYSCQLDPSQLQLTGLDNTATVKWDAQSLGGVPLDQGSADFTYTGTDTHDGIVFAQTQKDASVSVSDSLKGDLGTVGLGGDNPTLIKYPLSFPNDTPGTCSTHNNTARFTASDSGATDSASQTVTQCVGAPLKVSKDATPTFNRTYNWKISKSADQSVIDPGGTVNYTVIAQQNPGNPFTDSAWVVKGNITVANPNDWEPVTLAGLTDAVDNMAANGGSCSLDNGSAAGTPLAAGASQQFAYTCTYTSAPSAANGTNTATATWDASAAFTTDNSASGSKDFSFTTPTNTTNSTVHVTDSLAGPLGPVGPASDNVNNLVSQTFNYPLHFNPPASGCTTVNNTATITETGDHASASVKNCNSGALTMGFWQNKNGQAIIKNYSGTNCQALATWLNQFHPFSDLTATTCGSSPSLGATSATGVVGYVYNVIKAATCTSASKTCNSMLKAQMLATALNVYFSANGNNKINAPAPIGGLTVDLTHICKMIDGTGGTATCSGSYENASSEFGGAASMTVMNMLLYQNTSDPAADAGAVWYGQVKATQVVAKDAFDAINNQVVSSP